MLLSQWLLWNIVTLCLHEMSRVSWCIGTYLGFAGWVGQPYLLAWELELCLSAVVSDPVRTVEAVDGALTPQRQ